ncbi:hypothetical protein KC352_g42858, partial [Hortaea werneckii]
ENIWFFVVARHDDDNFWGRVFVQHSLDPALPADIMRDQLIDAEEPWYRQKTGKAPESEPLKDLDRPYREVLDDLRRKWQGDDHNRKEDAAHTREEDHVEKGQDPSAPSLLAISFLEGFAQTVEKSQQPENPFQKGCQHDDADHADIDDILDCPWCADRRYTTAIDRLASNSSRH